MKHVQRVKARWAATEEAAQEAAREAELKAFLQAAIDHPEDPSYGQTALEAIANYYNIQLAPGNHWAYESYMTITFVGDLNGLTPLKSGQTYYGDPWSQFGQPTKKATDDSSVYINGVSAFLHTCKMDVRCVAGIMGHEAIHSWIESKVESRGTQLESAPRTIVDAEEAWAYQVAKELYGDPVGHLQRQFVEYCEGSCENLRTTLEQYYGVDLSDLAVSVSP